jgi:toxin CcdB
VAQFDVFRNPGRQRETIPYVVVLQNARFDRGRTRFVAPLIRADLVAVDLHALAPRFTIEGQAVIMDVFNLATLPRDRLGPLVASLNDDESPAKLIRALDELVARG